MGIFDWLLLLLLAAMCWQGWRKGLVGTLLQLGGMILTFFLITHYFPLVKHGLMVKLHLGLLLSNILAVILILAMIALIVQVIRMLLERTLRLMHMSFLNSMLGALLGFLTGLLLVVILSVLIDFIPALHRPLDNPDKHRVYAAVRVVRSELYSAFNIEDKIPATIKLKEAADSLATPVKSGKKHK